MTEEKAYRVVPFSMYRRMIAASASVGRERNNIHAVAEVDITEARRIIAEHRQATGERPSLTAYIVFCLAKAIAENPNLNCFRKGRKLILLKDVTISVLVEREIAGQKVPEPIGIQAAQQKTYRQIHDEIRAAQQHQQDELGGLSGTGWVKFIPSALLRVFIRTAARSIRMARRFGIIGVTAVGMYGGSGVWFIPLSGATVTLTIGGIMDRPSLEGGRLETREHLCLTASFNHDIIDGAPAARFLKRLTELIESGYLLRASLGNHSAG